MQPASARHVPRPDIGALDYTLATTFGVGTNLKGRVAGAAWAFLLPTLELDAIVCLGIPTLATLMTLGRLGRLEIVCPDRARGRASARAAAAGIEDIVILDSRRATAEHHPFDLAVVAADAPDAAVVDAVVARARMTYVDGGAASVAADAEALWLAPERGEARQIAAATDARIVSFLRGDEHVAQGRGGLRGIVRRVVDRPARGARAGLLAGGDLEAGPPRYVREAAAAAGIDLTGCRVGLAAPSEYASRKVVMFVFAPDEPTPRWVVKLTRDPRHNDRLRNEWHALVRLRDAQIGDADTLPQPGFLGEHAGLTFVGQTAVTGTPLRALTDGTPNCPHAAAALRWLLELGERSVSATASEQAAGAALEELLERFSALYASSSAERAALARHVADIRRATVPLVFQHGDPGSWNIRITAQGRPIFLDWEAFEPRGIPLWDAFYLARSHAVTVGRARGIADALRAVRAAYLDEDGPMARALSAQLDAHCARIGLERTLAGSLFVTCWMHRALKEAGRLAPGRVHRGHYVNLLRATLARPDAPGLRRIAGA